MTRQLFYTGCELDRAADKRKNETWIKEKFHHPQTLILPIYQSRNLFTRNKTKPELLLLENNKKLRDAASQVFFLGLDNATPIFSIDLSQIEEDRLPGLVENGDFLNLRKMGPFMTQSQTSLAAYARGMHQWSLQHLYCSRCGSETDSSQGGHLRSCPQENCGRECYPRTDPAVIMLVEDIPEDGSPPRCLLGARSKASRKYSTLAGFVEPGESLEEAVAREVYEEAGIRVDDITYQASQPWPFPCSIMLGFRARAVSRDISVDEHELDDARWFTVEELKKAGEWGDPKATIQLSPKDSIARALINAWIKEQSQ